MPHTIAEMVRNWSREYKPTSTSINIDEASVEELDKALAAAERDYPSEYERIKSQIDYLAAVLYDEFEITKYPPHHSYPVRLRDWLNNVTETSDKQTLFTLAPRIFFIGPKEYLSLYHTALNGPIARWLIDQEQIDITGENAHTKLQDALSSTWFCAITDSMQIARFYHVNLLAGVDLRPEFRLLRYIAEASPDKVRQEFPEELKRKVINYMESYSPPLKRLVLLEDFVATGSQMKKTVRFASALRLDDPLPVFLCPLVVCQSGYRLAKELVAEFSNLSFEPTLVLDESVILPVSATDNEDTFLQNLRTLVKNTYASVAGDSSQNHEQAPYGPFGFGCKQEGGGLMVVLYTNCPDNTLPLIHHRSEIWNPLFPRSSRV